VTAAWAATEAPVDDASSAVESATEPPAAPTASADLGAVQPNELGKILVLQYHSFADEEEAWTRSRDNFRKDLQYLYEHDYHLVNISDLLDNRVRVPAGKSPVVLTFDDSSRGQFQLIEDADGTLRVDPETGLGILEAFVEQHPDFGRAGVFCILPGADPPNDLFGQPELREQKLRYLAERGYELCNHTLWHANLQEIDRQETVRQLALTDQTIQDAVPGYQVNTFCPPFGIYPEDVSPLLSGTFEGFSYQHRVILKVDEGLLTAPGHRDTDFHYVPRIQAMSELLAKYFEHFELFPDDRYVSDGDPDRMTFPTTAREHYSPTTGDREEPSPDPAYTIMRLRPAQ
jgi:peptidoglycan/xylan/chitin deacetylase (PgdA/CDA1 family)